MNAKFMPILITVKMKSVKKLLSSIFVVVFLFFSSSVNAVEGDTGEPIHVEADRMQYDSENKISRFFGNVIATQGTIEIRSAQMEVRQDDSGNELGVAIGSKEKRAYFKQDRDIENEYVEGEALRLEYDGRTSTLKLVGDAVVRRYKNNQLWDESTGGVITYNDKTSFYTVESGTNRASTTGRIKVVLTPESKK